MKKALVLSGGSIKGAFQAGAIAELLNSGFKPDAVYGTSVGSLNGGFLADRAGRAKLQGQDDYWPEIGLELEAFWNENITSFKMIGRKKSIPKLLYSIVFNKFDGFVDNAPLQNLIRRVFNIEHLVASPVKFYACAVNIANGIAIYADNLHPNILDYIIASTAIPLTMPISTIANEPYLDGGIREVAPLKKAILDGSEEIVCVACQPNNVRADHFDKNKILAYVDRLMEIVTNELVNNDLNTFSEINSKMTKLKDKLVKDEFLADKRYIPIKVIRPDETIQLDLEKFTPKEIRDTVRLGRETAREVLGSL